MAIYIRFEGAEYRMLEESLGQAVEAVELALSHGNDRWLTVKSGAGEGRLRLQGDSPVAIYEKRAAASGRAVALD